MRKCFLLKLNLRILAQLKVFIFVFPYDETHDKFQDEFQHKLVCKTMQTCWKMHFMNRTILDLSLAQTDPVVLDRSYGQRRHSRWNTSLL